MKYSIRAVYTKGDLKRFIQFPYGLYKNDKNWVAPLRIEEKKQYSEKTNPMLRHCEYQHFLLLKGKETIGRISAFINHLAVKHWHNKIGMFGSYECIDDLEASRLLLETARQWVHERGMKRMQGPWSFASQECGLVVEGFDSVPMIMAPYNPPYYVDQMERFGLKKEKDLKVYFMDGKPNYVLPDKFLKMADKIARRNNVNIRSVNMQNLNEDVKRIVNVANASTANNWGYIPVTDEEAHDLARSLKPIIDPDIVMLAEIDGRAVGYLIALPDINSLIRGLNGHLFPIGMFRLLFKLKQIRRYRIWALGVIPEYLRKALDVLFYIRLYEVLSPRTPVQVEANYVLEDNMVMNNPILKMGFEVSKTYRVYEKDV